MLENLRKTRAYRFCGYSFYYLLALLLVYFIVTGIYFSFYSHDLDGMDSFFCILYVLLGLVVHGFIILLILLISSIIAIRTKDKYSESKISKVADIGYCLMLPSVPVFISTLIYIFIFR